MKLLNSRVIKQNLNKMKKELFRVSLFIIVAILIVVLGGKYDTQINKENAIRDSIAESNKQYSLLGDSVAVEKIYNSLSNAQRIAIIVDMDYCHGDTIYKADIVRFYLLEGDYYDKVINDGSGLSAYTIL